MINQDNIIRWNMAYYVINKRTEVKEGREVVKIDIIPDSQLHMVIRITFNFMG